MVTLKMPILQKLTSSDHNAVHLIPTYKSLLKSNKPQVNTVYIWDNDSVEIWKAASPAQTGTSSMACN